MPIVEVEMVGPVADSVRVGLVQRIADAIGVALKSRPEGTWVKVRFLDAVAYAENGGRSLDGAGPVFVSVLLAELPDRQVLSQHALQVANAVAEACERPIESVHIIFEPAGTGRVAFGGHLHQ